MWRPDRPAPYRLTALALRLLTAVAYRTAQLRRDRSEVKPAQHRSTWEESKHFQPLRELIEQALVRYDWAEAFVLTNVVIRPRLDHWINEELAGALAPANGHPILRSMHFSLGQDSQWHRDWTAEAIRVSIADDPSDGDVICVWTEAWAPLADTAVASLARSAAEFSGVIAG